MLPFLGIRTSESLCLLNRIDLTLFPYSLELHRLFRFNACVVFLVRFFVERERLKAMGWRES